MSLIFFLKPHRRDTSDLAGGHVWKKKKLDDEEALLRYLLKQKENQPELNRKIDKDSVRETLLKHFKGEESDKILALVDLPEIVTAKDLFNSYLAITNKKRVQVLMALMMLDDENEQ